uniref:Uncharacterized protein n=1 Tax=Lepeophtheirus salmonis TaxID=72036 RepID=A0A0K2U0U3_LEPSM
MIHVSSVLTKRRLMSYRLFWNSFKPALQHFT